MTDKEKDAILHDDTGLRVEKVSSRTAFRGHLLRLSCDEVALPNGERAVWEIVRHRGAVCVVPVTGNGDVLLVRQFRYPYGEVTLEIPAGKLEYGEDPETCGKRELLEECGCTSARFEYVGHLYPTPAYNTEIIRIFLAEGLQYSRQDLDEGGGGGGEREGGVGDLQVV